MLPSPKGAAQPCVHLGLRLRVWRLFGIENVRLQNLRHTTLPMSGNMCIFDLQCPRTVIVLCRQGTLDLLKCQNVWPNLTPCCNTL